MLAGARSELLSVLSIPTLEPRLSPATAIVCHFAECEAPVFGLRDEVADGNELRFASH